MMRSAREIARSSDQRVQPRWRNRSRDGKGGVSTEGPRVLSTLLCATWGDLGLVDSNRDKGDCWLGVSGRVDDVRATETLVGTARAVTDEGNNLAGRGGTRSQGGCVFGRWRRPVLQSSVPGNVGAWLGLFCRAFWLGRELAGCKDDARDQMPHKEKSLVISAPC
ncbi:hypothetical protein B0T18DRAFT_396745 [Schizothecium vesticola]|uniref:Uncharacterized protein n=1 Tax=Schizothecium vesticola TaxID=314040 RepID=A0AA40KC58_9PEZI|nr:hypothetical protein B0T18DRAFT_396745 [Schizothecium vesticola]